MATKFKTHSEMIIDRAVKEIFPITEELDPERTEAYLRGVLSALSVTGMKWTDKAEGTTT